MSVETADNANTVTFRGKISKIKPPAYAPSGLPVLEFTLAFPQNFFGKVSFGYIEVLQLDTKYGIETRLPPLGAEVEIQGQLWVRRFRDRAGKHVVETKVLANSVQLKKA